MWTRFFNYVLQAWARGLLMLTEALIGLGDFPDGRPALPNAVDYEYFDLLDEESEL